MSNTTKTYLAIYKGKKAIIEAANSIEAQYKAIELLQPTKKYMLAIRLFDPTKDSI